MNRQHKVVLVLALLFSPAAGLAAPIPVGRAAPTFTLKTSEDKTVSLGSLKGRVVLLNFWARCAPCRVEMPWFEELSKAYAGKGMTVLGVSLDDEGWAAVLPAVSKLQVTYPIVLVDKRTAANYGMGELLPATFLIDRKGTIRMVKVGFGDRQDFVKTIEQLISER